MKKVFLSCCLNKNLGDDLFLKTITDRYDDEFYTITRKKYNKKFFDKNINLIYINYFLFKCLNRISRIFNNNNVFERIIIKKTDLVVVIGGSIFMEPKNGIKILKSVWYSNLNKKYYILGSNIGPYYSEDFVNDLINVYNNSEDTCLRDKKSFQLVSQSLKVRYASDIIFSLDLDKYIVDDTKIVSISVINCNKKSGQIKHPKQSEYEEKLLEIINLFLKLGYSIQLLSFCKDEGDEITVNNIMMKVDSDKVSKYFYNGNIDEMLYVLGKSSIIIGSRFHANVLGLVMNKTIIPIIYNNKTEELLNDINYNGLRIDINKIEKFNVNDLTDKDLNYKLDVSYQRKDAQRQFEKLDLVLKRKEQNE